MTVPGPTGRQAAFLRALAVPADASLGAELDIWVVVQPDDRSVFRFGHHQTVSGPAGEDGLEPRSGHDA